MRNTLGSLTLILFLWGGGFFSVLFVGMGNVCRCRSKDVSERGCGESERRGEGGCRHREAPDA